MFSKIFHLRRLAPIVLPALRTFNSTCYPFQMAKLLRLRQPRVINQFNDTPGVFNQLIAIRTKKDSGKDKCKKGPCKTKDSKKSPCKKKDSKKSPCKKKDSKKSPCKQKDSKKSPCKKKDSKKDVCKKKDSKKSPCKKKDSKKDVCKKKDSKKDVCKKKKSKKDVCKKKKSKKDVCKKKKSKKNVCKKKKGKKNVCKKKKGKKNVCKKKKSKKDVCKNKKSKKDVCKKKKSKKDVCKKKKSKKDVCKKKKSSKKDVCKKKKSSKKDVCKKKKSSKDKCKKKKKTSCKRSGPKKPKKKKSKRRSLKEKCGGDLKIQADKNIAALMYGKGDIRLQRVPLPKVGGDDALIAIDTVGICSTDAELYRLGKLDKKVIKKPVIMGHEASGIVMKLGKKVKKLKVGDRVAIEPGVPCRKCDFCKSGRYNLCPDLKFPGTPGVNGNLVHYFRHPADLCFKLPDEVTMEEGAMLETLAIGVAACRRAEVCTGSEVLILGSGAIGLATLLAAQAAGAAHILVTDVRNHRMKLAKEMGASDTMTTCSNEKAEDLVKVVEQKMSGKPTITIDCAGSGLTNKLGLLATSPGGCMVLIGAPLKGVTLPTSKIIKREIDVRGVNRYCNDFPEALAIAASGVLSLKKLVSHHFTIDESFKAMQTVITGAGNPLKVLIHVQKRDANNATPFDSDCK